jgi:hypothetical protein
MWVANRIYNNEIANSIYESCGINANYNSINYVKFLNIFLSALTKFFFLTVPSSQITQKVG